MVRELRWQNHGLRGTLRQEDTCIFPYHEYSSCLQLNGRDGPIKALRSMVRTLEEGATALRSEQAHRLS